MTFWGTVLAVAVGIFLYDFISAFIGAIWRLAKRRMDNKENRRIGFGDSEDSGKKMTKSTQMRKIGFGEQD